MAKAVPRSVTPLVKKFRDFLLGRTHTNPLRFGDYYSPRTQPPPQIPGGSADKLSSNYYYARDGRRETAPPNVLAISGKHILIEGKRDKETKITEIVSRTPGKLYRWD